MKQVYIFTWKNNEKRRTLHGRRLIVLGRMKMNSALVQFMDNYQVEVISRNAIRKVNP